MPVRALNLYYARDASLRAEVLATRLRASDVRAAIGVARGRVFRRVDGGPDLADVMWDCPFADAPAHDRDMDARAHSAEFEAVRACMRTLTRRFERVLYCAELTGANAAAGEAIGTPIAQTWIQGIDKSATDAVSPVAAIERSRIASTATLLRRLDNNVRLPDWIVETPASCRDDLSSVIASWIAAYPNVQAITFVWERVA